MAQFDNWPPFQDFTFQEFTFPADRYEEWECGQMISSGSTHFKVKFKYKKGIFFSPPKIEVDIIDNTMSHKLLSNITFDRATTSGDRILFYIAPKESNVEHTSVSMLARLCGYTRKSKQYERNEPILASVFTINHNIAKVSFSFGHPDRLIELY